MMKINKKKSVLMALISGFVLMSMSLSSCQNKQEQGWQQAKVDVMTVSQRTATVKDVYSASIKGQQDVDIYPQVQGTIGRIYVKEGQRVRKDQPLMQIDPRPYQDQLLSARAQLKAAQAEVEKARQEVRSKKQLKIGKVISQHDLNIAMSSLKVALANEQQAKAQVMLAKHNLGYTLVKSPADGVVGTLPFRQGALVSAQMTQPLTTISDNNRMYVYFSMNENQLRSLISQYGSPENTIRQMPKVSLQLNDGTMYGEQGYIESISGVINANTGTASVRAVIPNSRHLLFSGSVGNVVMKRSINNAIVVPQKATTTLQDKILVYRVVNGKAVSTEIKVLPHNDGKSYIVVDGLKAGDKIIGSGVSMVQDGMEI